MHNTTSALKQKVAHVASTLFLVAAMLVAGLVATNSFMASDATAYSQDVGTTSSICEEWNEDILDCVEPAVNCLCEIIVTPGEAE